MINNIPCPSCATPILVNTEEFLKGTSFACSNCDVKLGIEEKTDLDQEKLDLFKKFTKTKKERMSVIPCPDCGAAITFYERDLKKGETISCSSCNASVAL
ncbi:hypothetical protein LY01_01165 [Nonlabens xylanidelens]|uniref:Uncharacterized protein n=1 Tax=Nonlabens xylanidelens TaxID=191564 RepID=A0A2S6IMV9_9FLAO|nr:hypothetical protein [Nonlabens xylanidelens]PPK95574.1 hypothetical protein LY01_01165 [Nonlabens xylanidelens]PQJ22381.1 hypothetical protein BST94_02070 [Nonlabens xylanidelens]